MSKLQNSSLVKSSSLSQSQIGKKSSPSGRGVFDFESFTRPGVTVDDVREVKEAFDFFDADKTGAISVREFTSALKSFGFDTKNPEVYIMIESLDEDGSGTIDFQEFLGIMTAKVGENSSREELGRVFKLFDPQDTEFISLETLKKISQEVGDNLSDEELRDVLARCDIDKNGKMTFDDFYSVITTKLH